jgi:lipoprotein
MNRLIGAIWGVLICTLITLCSCKTKKAVQVESVKRTYDSTQTVKEQASVKYSLVDTSRIDEYTTLIREYIFDTPYYDNESCFVHDTNSPMVEYKGDGSVVIHHGLKSIKETKISRKSDRKGVSVQKDSTANKVVKTKVHATEQHKQKQRQVEQIAVSKPFDFWQLIVGVSILFAIAIALYYLYKRVPSVRNVVQRIRDRVRK